MEENKETQKEPVQNEKAEQQAENDDERDFRDNKLWALLSYLGVLVVFPLIMKRDSQFVQFHVKQGLVLLVGWVISWLPFGPIIGIVALVLSVIGIINVLNGEKKSLPIVGELAEKIKL